MAAWDDDNMILQVLEQAEHQARHFFILIQKWEIYQSKTPLHSQQVNTFEHTPLFKITVYYDLFGFCLCISISMIIPVSGSQEMQESAVNCPVGLYIIIVVINKSCVNIIPLKSCNYSFVQLYSKWNKSSSDLQPGSAAVTMAEFRGAIPTAWKTCLT